jgi:hypothetical protein
MTGDSYDSCQQSYTVRPNDVFIVTDHAGWLGDGR